MCHTAECIPAGSMPTYNTAKVGLYLEPSCSIYQTVVSLTAVCSIMFQLEFSNIIVPMQVREGVVWQTDVF
jgi:hypothetical protein